MDPTEQKPAYKITMDSSRGTIAQVAFVLVFCVGFIILEIRHLVLGHVTRVSPVMFLGALGCFVLAIQLRTMVLKLGLALIGIQASVRFMLSQVHASYVIKHLAAIVGRGLMIVGLLMIIFVIVKWFRSVIRRIPMRDPKVTTS